MVEQSALERRLRERRYREASGLCTDVLDGLGVAEAQRRVIRLDEVEDVWFRYLSRLRESRDLSETWPVGKFADVLRRIQGVREATSGMRVIWLSLRDSEPVGIEVPAGDLLDAGLSYLVSPAGDLMLTTPDVSSGICIEQNHFSEGDEYEVVGWGAFGVDRQEGQRSS